MKYTGVIIEESLDNKAVLNGVKTTQTKVSIVNEKHKTPWIKQWTMHTVEIAEENADRVAEQISNDLDKEHNWYADFKNEKFHFIIFRGKVFKVDLSNPVLYNEVKQYGISLGVPEYQLDFTPEDPIFENPQ
jgi:hypothetical protein